MNLNQPYDEQQQNQGDNANISGYSNSNSNSSGNDNGQTSMFAKKNGGGETEPEPFVPVKDGLYRARLVNTKQVESKRSGRPMI